MFENGHFQVLADDELRFDFVDRLFKDVESIIIVSFNGGGNADGKLDGFEITGPTITDAFALSSVGKLGTHWAMLKRNL